MGIGASIRRFFAEGLFDGKGPLILHVTKGLLNEQPIPSERLSDYEKSVLEKILSGEGANTPNALELSQVYVREPLATGKERYVQDLRNLEERAKHKEKQVDTRLEGQVDFDTIMGWALRDLIRKCETYRDAPYIAIRDGPLVLYLGFESYISEGEASMMLRTGMLTDFNKPAITLANINMGMSYRGSESAISYGNPVHCLKNIYEGKQKFQFFTSLWCEGYGSDSRIFTVTRLRHNSFEVYSKKGKGNREITSGSWHSNDEVIAAHAQK